MGPFLKTWSFEPSEFPFVFVVGFWSSTLVEVKMPWVGSRKASGWTVKLQLAHVPDAQAIDLGMWGGGFEGANGGSTVFFIGEFIATLNKGSWHPRYQKNINTVYMYYISIYI